MLRRSLSLKSCSLFQQKSFSGFLINVCASYCLTVVGSYIINMSFLNILSIGFLVNQFFLVIIQTLVWCIPTFSLQVLLRFLQLKCLKSKDKDFLARCTSCINLFESFSESFQYFLFLFFFATQLLNIFVTFLFFSNFYAMLSLGLSGYINIVCFLLQFFVNTYFAKTVTESIGKSFKCVKKLKSEAQLILLVTTEKKVRQYLKYIIKRIEDLQPMNACGYFIIDKSTLTSMVSVR